MKYILKKAPVKYYNEIFQKKKIGFSFCNKEGNVLKQMFHWVICRDFLSDALVAEEWKIKVNKYDFRYDPAKQQIDRDKTRLLLKFYNLEDVEYLLHNLFRLNNIERSNGLLRTTIKKVEEDTYLVEGSKMWLNSTFSLHLYTFLLKVMSYKYLDDWNWFEELKEEETNEGKYARQFIPEFLDVVGGHLKSLFKKSSTTHGYTKEYQNVTFIHDNGGALTLFRKEAENFVSTTTNEYYKRLVKIIKKA